MGDDKIGVIKHELTEFKKYSDFQAQHINTLGSRINDLENKVNALEKLIESITDIDWKTIRFRDRNETS